MRQEKFNTGNEKQLTMKAIQLFLKTVQGILDELESVVHVSCFSHSTNHSIESPLIVKAVAYSTRTES